MRISSLGEFGLIDFLARGAPRSERVQVGIGDDTALVSGLPGVDYLLTCDMMFEGVHFRRAWYEGRPDLLGRKALGVNISDIASKGGQPRFCLVTLGAGADLEAGFLRGVYDGLYDLAGQYGISVVGGDTAGIPAGLGLMLDIFLVGEIAPGAVRLRSGARPGDVIAVTGEFGLSRAGLQLLEHPRNESGAWFEGPSGIAAEATLRQLVTPVRLPEALALAGQALPSAMSDTSDGLANQVHHICRASGVGAVIDAGLVPVASATGVVAAWAGRDPLAWALWGGEDYELMLTIPPEQLDAASMAVNAIGRTKLTVVGKITEGKDIILAGTGGEPKPLAFGGYDHFPAVRPGQTLQEYTWR